MEKEYLDVLDQYGNRTGIVKTRENVHQSGDFHRVVHTWIFNDKYEILLQKRSQQKENHPGCWDISSAGHVHALESSLDALKREAKEELGINLDPKNAQFITTIKRIKNPLNQELADIFLYKMQGNEVFHFNDNEVEDAKYFSIAQIKMFLQNLDSKVVFREEYPIIFQKIEQEKNLQL